MSGNADEWCGDWFDANYYYTSPSLNPTGPENGYTRVIRGGSWVGDATDCRVSARFHQYVDRRFIIGLRLARSVE
jgi:formylglycine-generating enzyme required for sulfatase activity